MESSTFRSSSRRTAAVLGILVVVAAGLAWRLPGDAVARSLFQSSPVVTNTPMPTATPSSTATETTSVTDTPVPTIPASATPAVEFSPTLTSVAPSTATPELTPSSVPVESLAAEPLEEQLATPAEVSSAEAKVTPPGFLPPPTLTLPGGQMSGPAPSLLPQPGPPLAAPPAPLPEPATQPEPALGEVPSAAQLIDNALLALSYGWLCCGVAALIVAASAFVWLAWRTKRGSRSPDAEGDQPDDAMG